MAPGLQLVRARFSNFLPGKLSQEFKFRRMSIFHEIQVAIFRYCVMLQLHRWARWYSYAYCVCWHVLDPIQGQGQDHGAFELPTVSETVHAGGDDHSPLAGLSGFLAYSQHLTGIKPRFAWGDTFSGQRVYGHYAPRPCGETSMGESPMGWANRPWGEMSSAGRKVHGAKWPWGETSIHGANCQWGEKVWHL